MEMSSDGARLVLMEKIGEVKKTSMELGGKARWPVRREVGLLRKPSAGTFQIQQPSIPTLQVFVTVSTGARRVFRALRAHTYSHAALLSAVQIMAARRARATTTIDRSAHPDGPLFSDSG